MAVDFQQLALQIQDAINSYVVPAPHPDQLGEPLPPEWFEAGLRQMRAALVEPYELQVFESHAESGKAQTKTIVVVADDGAQTLLAFDPRPDGDFVLIWRSGNEHWISNISGDPVGCFLSI